MTRLPFRLALILTCLALSFGDASAQLQPTFVKEWGRFGRTPGLFNLPSASALDAAGNLYVCDYHNHRIQKFDPDGNFLLEFAAPGPWDAAVAPDGSIYVSCGDPSAYEVRKFDAAGGLVTHWPLLAPNGVMRYPPYGIAVDPQGAVYVGSDSGRVFVFDAAGTALRGWVIRHATASFNWVAYDIEADGDGNIFVADEQDGDVQKFDSLGNPLLAWGSPGSLPGLFLGPKSLAVGPGGIVYVTDGANRVQAFTTAGQWLSQWGTTGSGPGQFSGPWGVEASAGGDIYVVDQNHHRVQKFSMSPTPVARTSWGRLKSLYR